MLWQRRTTVHSTTQESLKHVPLIIASVMPIVVLTQRQDEMLGIIPAVHVSAVHQASSSWPLNVVDNTVVALLDNYCHILIQPKIRIVSC